MSDRNDLKSLSVYLAKILRHNPEIIGITLDEHGWAEVSEVIRGISETRRFDMETLEKIVAEDNKQRYSFNEDKTLIRANQGHSVKVDVELKSAVPPEKLYHGTAERFVGSILREGLLPMSRLYVHLSRDYDTAVTVGKRHGKPFVFEVNAAKMTEDGFEFFLSENNVWLTKRVPAEYLTQLQKPE